MASSKDKKIAFLTAFGFVTFEILFEAYVFQLNYATYFLESYHNKSNLFFAADVVYVCVSFLLLYLFVYFSLTSSLRYKTVYFLIFLTATVIEFSYQKSLGRFSHLSDFDAAYMTTWKQKMSSLLMYITPQPFITCSIFLILLLLIKSKTKITDIKKFALALSLFLLFFSVFAEYKDYLFTSSPPSIAMNAFYQTNVDYIIKKKLTLEDNRWELTETAKRLPVTEPNLAPNYQPENNIILVIDESVTGTHLSLNGYERKTTPFLDDLENRGLLYNWKIATASCTNSLNSYRAIISGTTPDEIEEHRKPTINEKQTLFQYAKAMRYKTYYFDGQLNEYWCGSTDDRNYIDTTIGVDQLKKSSNTDEWEADNRIAKEVNKIIESSQGNFIVIFKHGSHTPYQKNFPPSETVWKPTYNTVSLLGVPSEDRIPEVTNAYDNSIKYNLNSFFENLIDDYDNIPNNTVILYTSDHGQTLFVGGRASHGGNSKIEASVPFFIVGKLDKKPDTNYKVSHYNITPTALDLMKYPENLRPHPENLSVLKAQESDTKPRFYNPNLGKKIPFD